MDDKKIVTDYNIQLYFYFYNNHKIHNLYNLISKKFNNIFMKKLWTNKIYEVKLLIFKIFIISIYFFHVVNVFFRIESLKQYEVISLILLILAMYFQKNNF